jgi:hypothetical protein
VIPIRIKEIYIRISENHIFLIIIKNISIDKKFILLVIIILGVLIIGS